LRPKRTLNLIILVIAAPVLVLCQSGETNRRNNPYSPSPAGREALVAPSPVSVAIPNGNDVAFMLQPRRGSTADTLPKQSSGAPVNIVQNPTAKAVSERSLVSRPTEVYRFGVGDVLHITLRNSRQGSGYYPVNADGTIDYPMAGENLPAEGLTADELEMKLKSKIKLFPNPSVEVKVRDYQSHKVEVTGLVDSPGEKPLQREAMPLFAVKAGAFVRKEATGVKITRREGAEPEIHRLSDAATDNIFIYPGTRLEFFIVALGEYTVATPGGRTRNELPAGLTLSAALRSAGFPNVEKVSLRRKGEPLKVDYDVKSLLAGKILNPVLLDGDEIEIRNR
jgi:protein involved in polysaccharide export with SLBB domain